MLRDSLSYDIDYYLNRRQEEEYYRDTHCGKCQGEFSMDELEEGLCGKCKEESYALSE